MLYLLNIKIILIFAVNFNEKNSGVYPMKMSVTDLVNYLKALR